MAAFSLSVGNTTAGVVLSALTINVPSVQFQPQAVRVVSANSTATVLLLGGLDTTSGATYPGVVVYGSVAAGSSTLSHVGSAVLPSIGSGVVQLSQTSVLHKGYVLASTDQGVFKCASWMPVLFSRRFAPKYLHRRSSSLDSLVWRLCLLHCRLTAWCASQHLLSYVDDQSTADGRVVDNGDIDKR